MILNFIKKLFCCKKNRNIIIKENENQEIGKQFSYEELKRGYTYVML